MATLTAAHVPFSEVSAHRATLEDAYLQLTKDAVQFRAGRAGGSGPWRRGGSAMTDTLYRSQARPSGDAFSQLLRAEWVKFRSVRGWVAGLIVAALAIMVLGLGPSATGSCGMNGPASDCAQTLGPGGEPVTDSFYFVHQSLDGNGSITARMTALTGRLPDFSGNGRQTHSGLAPWAKAGIIIKASDRQGSSYAALMITGSHGAAMQYDYTGDVASPPAPGWAGSASAASPRWLRLTRSGDTLTGYDSADGAHWTKVAAVTLAGLSSTVQGGLFATSPQYSQISMGQLSLSTGPTQATGAFDHLSLRGAWPDGAWAGTAIGAPGGPRPAHPEVHRESRPVHREWVPATSRRRCPGRPGSESRSRRPSSACSPR